MEKLFVYGIFLGEANRLIYGMTNPRYAVVPDYATVLINRRIVEAVPVPPEVGTGLTGLLVDIDPSQWDDLDKLEAGYKRIMVTTTDGVPAHMYAATN
jgi:hypothetical protein